MKQIIYFHIEQYVCYDIDPTIYSLFILLDI